jgi:hypothetical protein
MRLEAHRKQNRVLTYAGRAAKAAVFLVINYAIFFFAPSSFFSTTGLLTSEIEATISSYFLVIASLTALNILLKDNVIGLASSVCLGLVQALYIYVITDGGVLTISLSGLALTLKFKMLLYLMMAIPAVNMLKQISDYLSRSSTQPIEMVEVEG